MQHYCDQLHMLMSLQTPEQWNNIFANKLGHEEGAFIFMKNFFGKKEVGCHHFFAILSRRSSGLVDSKLDVESRILSFSEDTHWTLSLALNEGGPSIEDGSP